MPNKYWLSISGYVLSFLRLPNITMYSILYPNFFLFTDMCVFGRITDSKITGKLISIGGFNQLFYMFRFLPMGIRKAHANPSAVAANRIFSMAAHAEAK